MIDRKGSVIHKQGWGEGQTVLFKRYYYMDLGSPCKIAFGFYLQNQGCRRNKKGATVSFKTDEEEQWSSQVWLNTSCLKADGTITLCDCDCEVNSRKILSTLQMFICIYLIRRLKTVIDRWHHTFPPTLVTYELLYWFNLQVFSDCWCEMPY